MNRWLAGLGAALLLCSGAARAQIAQGGGPMDISADHFEVFDPQKMAVYKGKVEILQGQNRMRADQVTIYYTGGPAAGTTPAPKAANAPPGATLTNIDHLEADGNVYFVTPTQTIRGDKAVYTSAADTIVVTGTVVVAQGENVMRGEHLTVHVKAGTSQMEGAGGRVRTIIYPDKKS